MGSGNTHSQKVKSQAQRALGLSSWGFFLIGSLGRPAWTQGAWQPPPSGLDQPTAPSNSGGTQAETAPPTAPVQGASAAQEVPRSKSEVTNRVIEVPRGWLPQRSVQARIPWWQVGLNLTNQLITPISNGNGAPFNSVTAVDLATSFGTGLNRSQPRGELDRWSLNLHLSNFSASANIGAEAGLVANWFYPQSLFQSPSGLWLQGLWFQRNGLPHERLAQIRVGNLNLGNSFLHGAATNLYINGLISGHNGVSVPGVPYGPLNALAATATVRLGDLKSRENNRNSLFRGSLRFGLFQLNAGRNDSHYRGFNQSISADDGLLELIEWQWPLAKQLTHCDEGKQDAVGSVPKQPGRTSAAGSRFVAPSGCQSSRLIQNQLPEPMLQLSVYNANWRFAGVNGPSNHGLALPGHAPAGTQANGVSAYLVLPTPLALPFASRLWVSGSLSGPASLNPYPGFLAGGWIGQGLIAHRPEDLLIVGLAGSSTSAALKPSQPSQAVLELSYQLQLTSKLSFQPYSQLQSGAPGLGPLWTIGLQWSWSL